MSSGLRRLAVSMLTMRKGNLNSDQMGFYKGRCSYKYTLYEEINFSYVTLLVLSKLFEIPVSTDGYKDSGICWGVFFVCFFYGEKIKQGEA